MGSEGYIYIYREREREREEKQIIDKTNKQTNRTIIYFPNRSANRYLAVCVGLPCAYLAYFTQVYLLLPLCKWFLIGKFKPGKYPIYGHYYFRWWLVLHSPHSFFYILCLGSTHPSLYLLFLFVTASRAV